LEELLAAVQSVNGTGLPLLLKIAPDLEWGAIEEILALVESHGLSGLIATNTTIDHSQVPLQKREQGGLSGQPLKKRALEVLRFITARTRLPVIGVGGIACAEDAKAKFDAGASLVQIYTGLIYEGPGMVRAILEALLRDKQPW
jgi:dihydroorotate dehydrogenase